MRSEAQARGRCHHAHYWELTQILLSNVDGSNAISVIGPSALGAMKHPPFDLAPHIATPRASPAGVVLILQGNAHAQALRLVGEFEADRAVGPLVDFLVGGMPKIVVLPDISHIANDHRSHALLMQRGDKPRGLLVLNILDLVFDLLQLPLLGPDEPLAAFAALLHLPIDAAIQFGLQFVAVLHFGAQEPPVQDVRLLTVMGHRHVHLAQVNPYYPLASRLCLSCFLLIGGYRLVLRSRPVDDHRLWQFPRPVEEKRRIALAVREAQCPLLEAHS